jgi:hypothetical protein
MAVDLKWLIGALVCFVIVIGVLIPTTITAGNEVTPAGTATGELWTGTAATAHASAFKPVASVTAFKKEARHTIYNDTVLVGGHGTVTLYIDPYTVATGEAWNNINFTFTLKGLNATNNVTWVAGTCRPANATWTSSPQSYTDVASTCLTPGSTLTFTFTNKTSQENETNVTNVTLLYSTYDDSSAYALASASGEFTPTASGYYYMSYTYGNQSGTSTQMLVLLLPLVIAAALLVIFLKTSGLF